MKRKPAQRQAAGRRRQRPALSGTSASYAVVLFQPRPDVFYGLEATAHLAGIPRRSLLLCCRAGLVHPVAQPPYGVMGFTDEMIQALRRIEHLRTVHGLSLGWIKTMFGLRDEVTRLRAELHDLQHC